MCQLSRVDLVNIGAEAESTAEGETVGLMASSY